MNFLIMKKYLFLIIGITSFFACDSQNPKAVVVKDGTEKKLQLDKIQLPEGFQIEVYAEGVNNARSMCLSPNGTLFVGTRNKGNLYAIRDNDGDYKADEVFTLAKGLRMPNGVAFKDGSLYVAEVSRVLRYDDIENRLADPSKTKNSLRQISNRITSWLEIYRIWARWQVIHSSWCTLQYLRIRK